MSVRQDVHSMPPVTNAEHNQFQAVSSSRSSNDNGSSNEVKMSSSKKSINNNNHQQNKRKQRKHKAFARDRSGKKIKKDAIIWYTIPFKVKNIDEEKKEIEMEGFINQI